MPTYSHRNSFVHTNSTVDFNTVGYQKDLPEFVVCSIICYISNFSKLLNIFCFDQFQDRTFGFLGLYFWLYTEDLLRAGSWEHMKCFRLNAVWLCAKQTGSAVQYYPACYLTSVPSFEKIEPGIFTIIVAYLHCIIMTVVCTVLLKEIVYFFTSS